MRSDVAESVIGLLHAYQVAHNWSDRGIFNVQLAFHQKVGDHHEYLAVLFDESPTPEFWDKGNGLGSGINLLLNRHFFYVLQHSLKNGRFQ